MQWHISALCLSAKADNKMYYVSELSATAEEDRNYSHLHIINLSEHIFMCFHIMTSTEDK